MKEWFIRFWNDHGDRMVFMGLATCFAMVFIGMANDRMEAAGETILIGIAMLLYNKARSSPKEEKPSVTGWELRDRKKK